LKVLSLMELVVFLGSSDDRSRLSAIGKGFFCLRWLLVWWLVESEKSLLYREGNDIYG